MKAQMLMHVDESRHIRAMSWKQLWWIVYIWNALTESVREAH